MFADLYDSISLLWSWRWPSVFGEVTAVDVERVKDSEGHERFRLAVAYRFSVGGDGPYTGESFWEPTFFSKRRVTAARHHVRIRYRVSIRYRPDDPSINRVDRRSWQDLLQN